MTLQQLVCGPHPRACYILYIIFDSKLGVEMWRCEEVSLSLDTDTCQYEHHQFCDPRHVNI